MASFCNDGGYGLLLDAYCTRCMICSGIRAPLKVLALEIQPQLVAETSLTSGFLVFVSSAHALHGFGLQQPPTFTGLTFRPFARAG